MPPGISQERSAAYRSPAGTIQVALQAEEPSRASSVLPSRRKAWETFRKKLDEVCEHL